jgi:RimJ/RimL family protein N-acetyltransferase
MILRPITREECQVVRVWRNDPAVWPILRTKEPITEAQQDAFYDAISGPDPEHLYYALEHDGQFIGTGGLTYLRRVPGEAEISLVLGPAYRGRGLGTMAVDALLEQARVLGLTAVIGECYATGNLPFWTRQIQRVPATMTWRWDLARG